MREKDAFVSGATSEVDDGRDTVERDDADDAEGMRSRRTTNGTSFTGPVKLVLPLA